MRALLALFAGLAGWLLAPAAPTNVTAALAPRADSAVVTCRWTPPAGQVGTNIRLVPASDPALSTGDYADGLVYHQRGLETPLRTADTIRLGYPVAPVSVRCAVRAGDATFAFGPFAVSAPVTLAPPSVVPAPTPTQLVVVPLTASLQVGGSFRAQATLRDAAGTVLALPITWRSSPGHTTVDATGQVLALTVGLDTVSASGSGLVGRVLVTVTAPPPPPPPPPPPVLVVGCGIRIPPPVGCGMRDGSWALAGIDTVSRIYGPWFMDDSLGHPHKVVRVVVADTTF